MAPRDGGRGIRRRQGTNLLLAASQRLYGTLLALYPKSFRRRYAVEMRRDFADVTREGLEEGGGTELVRLWCAAFSDLVVTALKERGPVLSRNAHPSVDPRIAARAIVAVLLVALIVAMASFTETPQYEASVMLLVGQELESDGTPENALGLEELTQTMTAAVASRPVAEAVIRQEGLSTRPEDFLEQGLGVEQVPQTQFIEVVYTDTDPERAQRVANAVGDESSQRVSEVGPSADAMTATLWEPAPVPEEPASPNPLRNGVLALVSGLLLFVGLAFALPRFAASGVGRVALRISGAVGLTASGSRGAPTGAPPTKGAKEKELLEALGRRGKLTVEEADRMLSALAAKGHLEVRVEHGRLLYSL